MTRRLRIAIFVHEFPALSETFVLNQVTGLMDLGHEVTVLAVGPRPESRVHADVERYGLRERVLYPALPVSRLGRIARAAWLFLRHGWRHGRVLLRCLDARRYGRDATSLRLFFWAVRLAGEAPFDVIHCHFGPVGQLAAKLRDAGALAGRLVTVFHGVDVSAYVRDRPDYYRFLFARGELFLPISRIWGQKLVELGCDAGRIRVHRMGIDVRRYPFRPRHYRSERPLRVVTVGRMVEKKGIEYALRALAEVARQGIAVEYDVVGNGPLRGDLERLAGTLGLAPSVRFHGWQEQAAVSALMNEGDVLLAPSVTAADGDQEGIPVTLMEAMATGMLVVSTYHSGIPELVEHERSGLLVPERDVGALAGALVRLTRSPDDWPSMSQAARRRVVADFEISRLNAALVDHFEALLGTSRAPRPVHAGHKLITGGVLLPQVLDKQGRTRTRGRANG
ncbi:glycosyltransferase [Shumkonia mesophila]|uniref:glycosyltransferase n=1 Tax=Shumkonia mesophila TaxID=2838854 RepID=UPI00293489C1|nr:glycosyltransferase [Shumkonia mesophila]